jgi:mono/diheme cytochrome c family protein/cytochrome c553
MKRKLIISATMLCAAISGIVIAAPPKVLTLNGSKSAALKPVEVVKKAPELSKGQADFFESKVRPVLAANCFKCHSTEGGKVKGGLLLDSRDGWMKGGENGTVIVPGDPAKSRLITAISYTDGDLQMPPKGEKLSAKEIADLTAWVKMGAPDPRTSAAGSKLTGLNDKAKAHWAYQPVRRPAVPAVKDASWVKSPVDAFVLAKLEQNQMAPSPAATKEALIRRATYDLIGLPPTPEEVAAFVSDTSPTAFAKVVDRLLASPHYGERWGRFWLDSARYSDTTGIEGNARNQEYRYAHAWTYRDYVIHAFNEDKPYDQFLMEQIAADKLPVTERDPSRLAALGFITVGKRFQNPNDLIDERIDALSKTTMGLTVACARCHDHKFDPIPTADYYSLHGVFASTVEPGMGANKGKYGNKMEASAMAAAEAAEEKAAKLLAHAGANNADFADYQQKRMAIEQKNRDTYFDLVQQKGDEFRKNAAGYVLIGMYGRKGDRDDLITRNKLIAELGLDREIYQQFRLRPAEAAVFGPALRFSEVPAEQIPSKAKELLAEIATGKLAGGGKFGRITVNPLVVAAFRNISPESIKTLRDVTAVYGKLFADLEPQAKAFIQANRTATTGEVKGFDPNLVDLIQIPAPVHTAAEIADSDRLKSFIQELPQQNGAAYRKFSFTELNELDLTHPGAPAMPMIVTDAPVPHNSPIFIRGEAQNRGPIVPRQFLEIVAGPNRKPFTIGSGRLELAQAIASKSNPLTARAMINRIWMHHFGEAFVRTPDDLGVQSEPPSHPELLDYLASRFMQEGWSIKQMHRMIMLSNTYQQTSDTNLKYADKDPANRLLWRANLRRLDFEAVRDTMVQFTGKADLTVGGKPVNLTEEPYSNRRSVYGYIDRGSVPELMQQFDFSDPDMTNSKRTSTIVPQQALFFMNSAMSVDVARKVTNRPEFMAATDDAGRVKAIYEVLYQREPHPEEIAFAMDFVSEEKDSGEPTSPRSAGDGTRKTPGKFVRKFQKPNGGKYGDGRRAVQNQGDFVERKPLSPWELYTQALLFTNELAYVN